MTHKYKIFIDSGGWYIAYYMGLFHYIFTEFGVDCFKRVHFEGISAGGQTCGYALATIHGCGNMKYWIDHGPKHAIYYNNYGAGRLTLGCYNAGVFFYQQLNSQQRRAIKKYFCSICTDTSFNPYYCTRIKNKEDFGSAVASTGNIPFIGSLHAWKYRDKLLWDGGLNINYPYGSKKTYNADHLLFISVSKYNLNDDIVYLDISSWMSKNIKDSYFASFYNQYNASLHADILFQNGFNDARNHRSEIYEKLKLFGVLT